MCILKRFVRLVALQDSILLPARYIDPLWNLHGRSLLHRIEIISIQIEVRQMHCRFSIGAITADK